MAQMQFLHAIQLVKHCGSYILICCSDSNYSP